MIVSNFYQAGKLHEQSFEKVQKEKPMEATNVKLKYSSTQYIHPDSYIIEHLL